MNATSMYLPRSGLRPISPEMAFRIAAEFVGIAPVNIHGPGRHRLQVSAREIFVWIGREYTLCSFPELAQFLHRNHSTLVTAHKRLTDDRTMFTKVGGATVGVLFGECRNSLRRHVETRIRQAEEAERQKGEVVRPGAGAGRGAGGAGPADPEHGQAAVEARAACDRRRVGDPSRRTA